jgi:hypothetical protein
MCCWFDSLSLAIMDLDILWARFTQILVANGARGKTESKKTAQATGRRVGRKEKQKIDMRFTISILI